MDLMKNLLTESDLRKTPVYELKPDHYNFDISISNEGVLCIIANYDYNFREWVSLGEIGSSAQDSSVKNSSAKKIGDCINHIISKSPSKVYDTKAYKVLDREGVDWRDHKYLWLSEKIIRRDGLFMFGGEELEFSSEKISLRIMEFYNNQLHECKLLEERETSITEYLSKLCFQLEENSKQYNPSLAQHYSKNIEKSIDDDSLRCLGLSGNVEVRNTYRKYRELKEDIYQAYMNYER